MNIKKLLLLFLLLFGTITTAQVRLVESNIELSKEKCLAPTFLLSESQSTKSVKITWQGVPEHTRYQLQYKKQDVRNAQWFSSNSLNTQSLINPMARICLYAR
jgi:hypothetical protein